MSGNIEQGYCVYMYLVFAKNKDGRQTRSHTFRISLAAFVKDWVHTKVHFIECGFDSIMNLDFLKWSWKIRF